MDEAKSFEDLIRNKLINAIFEELCSHESAHNYARYLFNDIAESLFEIDTIAQSQIEDTETLSQRRSEI